MWKPPLKCEGLFPPLNLNLRRYKKYVSIIFPNSTNLQSFIRIGEWYFRGFTCELKFIKMPKRNITSFSSEEKDVRRLFSSVS